MKRSHTAMIALALGWLMAAPVGADPIHTYAQADYQLGGSGSNSVVLVVDWNDGTPQDSISFGLMTNAPTIGDALLEVDQASVEFDVNLIRYSFGPFGDTFAFDAQRTTELDPVTDTPYSGSNGEYTHDFSTGYSDAGDHLETNTPAPTYSPYFSTWTGTQGVEGWSFNSGLQDAAVDGGAYGFSYGDGTFGPDTIPEPSVLLLLLSAFGVLVWKKHSKS